MSENVSTGYKSTIALVGKRVVVVPLHEPTQRYEGVLVRISHATVEVPGCKATFEVDLDSGIPTRDA
jgi:hypothetical protein